MGQTHPDIEVVALDNGSTDGTGAILRSFESDPRVSLVTRSQNITPTILVNEAVRRCRGDFISVLYGDDYYLPEKTARQLEAFADLPRDFGVVYSPGYRVNVETDERWIPPSMTASGWILEEMLRTYHDSGFINPVSPLLRAECMKRYPLHEDLRSEGEALFLRVATTHRFHYLDEPLVVQRDHARSAGRVFRENREIFIELMARLEREPSFPESCRRALDMHRGRTLRNYAYQGARLMADPAWARESLRLALRFRPALILQPRTAAALLLSLLPKSALLALNSAANRLRRHREVLSVKEGWK